MTTDLKAAHHVLFNSYDYPKVEVIRHVSRQLFGNGAFLLYNLKNTLMTLLLLGLLNVEGDEHKQQVRFLLQDLFADCCLILQVAQDFGQ